MTRLPYTPRVPPALVCILAVGAAGLVSSLPITAALQAAVRDGPGPPIGLVAPSVTAGAVSLALLVADSRHFGAATRSCLGSGAVMGIAAAIGICIADGDGAYLLDLPVGYLAAAALCGVCFGAFSLVPALTLVATYQHSTHSARDAQIVKTCVWLCCVAGLASRGASEERCFWGLYAIVAVAITAAGHSAVRRALRRRWLRRVSAGSDPLWELEAPISGLDQLPDVELVSWWSDERALIRVDRFPGSPYRAAERRTAVGRVAPRRAQ